MRVGSGKLRLVLVTPTLSPLDSNTILNAIILFFLFFSFLSFVFFL